MLVTSARSALIARVVQTVLDNSVRKIFPRLDQKQAEDQAGFRSSYQTTDHLAMYRMIEQKCHEWGSNMWTATIDFTKAFDSITHTSIWQALKSCDIEHNCISLLKKIYRDRKHLYRLTKRATCSRSRKEPNRVILCQACFSTRLCRKQWKKTSSAGKRKKESEST